MDCKSYLKQMRELSHQATRYEEKIEQLQCRAEKMTSSWSGMPMPTAGDGVTTWEILIDMKIEYNKLLRSTRLMEREIEQFISSLPNSLERMILRRRYLDNKEWRVIAEELDIDLRQLYRLHGRALESARGLYHE